MPEQSTSSPSSGGSGGSDKLSDETRRALELQASGKPPAFVEAEQERIDEYADFVAVVAIDFNDVRAYNVGDAVPKSNVEKFSYDQLGWVAKRTTKAGKEAVAELTGSEA